MKRHLGTAITRYHYYYLLVVYNYSVFLQSLYWQYVIQWSTLWHYVSSAIRLALESSAWHYVMWRGL